eukprot:325513_1
MDIYIFFGEVIFVFFCESVCYNNQICVCMVRFLCACIDSEIRSCVYFRNICILFITIIVPFCYGFCYGFCMCLVSVWYVFDMRLLFLSVICNRFSAGTYCFL